MRVRWLPRALRGSRRPACRASAGSTRGIASWAVVLLIVGALGLLAIVGGWIAKPWKCVLFGCQPVATCPGAATFPATPPQPAVASIDVLPAMLQLRAPATSAALLEARPRDAEGFEIAEVFGVPLNWSVSTGPLTSGVPAPRLFRIALPASTSSPGSANVQATVSSGVQGGPADVQYALQ